jgi:hypothetical protein
VLGVGAVVEAAIGERAAQPFVEEEKEQRNLNLFGGETIVLLRRNRTDRPLQWGFLLRHLQLMAPGSRGYGFDRSWPGPK